MAVIESRYSSDARRVGGRPSNGRGRPLPFAPSVADRLAGLTAVAAAPHCVVTCYLKLEPRDRTRGKYLIKLKNRVKGAADALSQQALGHADREAIAADLQRVLDYLEEPNHLPSTRAI